MNNTLSITYVLPPFEEKTLHISIGQFPGGEINVCLPEEFMAEDLRKVKKLSIDCRIADSTGVMALILLDNALSNTELFCPIILNLGYIPYGRQDRICNPGEAFSSEVFSKLINSLSIDKINVLDPHSKISSSKFNARTFINTQQDMLVRIPWMMDYFPKHGGKREITLVAPDKGATGKVNEAAEALEIIDTIQGLKIRDPKSGNLSGFSYEGDVEGKHLLIVDDICDGGGTFIGLIKELWKGNPAKIDLYVSHGIFSKGVQCLFDSGLSNIYTTDTVLHGQTHKNLHTIKWY